MKIFNNKVKLKVAVCSSYSCYRVCFPWQSNPLPCYLHILSCLYSSLPFSACVSWLHTHTCLSHTLVIGNLLWYPVYSEDVSCFLFLVKFLLIAPLCCLGDLLSSLSRSLFGHSLFRQGSTSARAVQI